MRRLLFLLSLIGIVLSYPAFAAGERFVTIGTADELGVYYPAGGAICRLLKRGMKNHGIRCFVESTPGSVYNLEAIRNRKLDMGIVQTDLAYNAYNGSEEFKGEAFNPKLRTVLSLHLEAFTVLVRHDSSIQRFKDIRGKKVNFRNIGSGVHATMERIMRLEKWSTKSFAERKEMNMEDQTKALCAGEIDVIVYMAGHPNGAVREATNRCKTRIIPVEGEEIDALIKKYPFYYKTVIPAGMYPANAASIPTIATRALLVATSDLDEGIVYELVKSVMDNLDNFKTLHPVFATLSEARMATEGFVAPAHPGSLRYFKEKGLIATKIVN